MALRLLSDTVPKITGKTFSRKYIALGKIFALWEEIMGEEMAAKSQPVKIHYKRKKNQRDMPEARLDIAADSATCAVLVYRKDLILQKINRLFGDGWVTDIKFIHADDAVKKTIAKRRRAPLREEDKEFLALALEEITDPDIKERLQSFGEAYLKDKKR